MIPLQTFLTWLEALLRLRGVQRRTFGHDGMLLSYHEYGSRRRGHTVVLVHGLGTSNLTWVKVLGRLARRHHVYAVDLPGWGHSPLPAGAENATIPMHAEAVTRFVDSLPEKPVVLVGQSLGGWVCAKVAAARPDLVEHLVLCNNAGVLYPEVGELRAHMDLRTHEQVEAFWRILWHKVPALYRFFKEDYVAKMQGMKILGFFDSVQEGDFINGDLARITMPVSILWGTSDRFIPASTVDEMVAHLPDARVYWIPRCGHIPALERPREFLRLMNAILPPRTTSGGLHGT